MINLLSGIASTSAALNAERIRLEVIGENIANANTTRGLDGKPYQRKQVVFENILRQQLGARDLDPQPAEVRVAQIQKDLRPVRSIYNPGHPDADSHGMVAVANQGINLAPLNQPVPRSTDFNTLSPGFSEPGFAQSNTGHQTPHPPPQKTGEAAESYSPAGFRSEPEPSRPANVARRQGARWETWA